MLGSKGWTLIVYWLDSIVLPMCLLFVVMVMLVILIVIPKATNNMVSNQALILIVTSSRTFSLFSSLPPFFLRLLLTLYIFGFVTITRHTYTHTSLYSTLVYNRLVFYLKQHKNNKKERSLYLCL